MSDFEDFDEIVKNKKQNDISDDEQSIEDTEEGEKIAEDDASTDGEDIIGFESDIEEDFFWEKVIIRNYQLLVLEKRKQVLYHKF